MDNSKSISVKLLIILLVPMLAVTLGGLIVYKSYSNFFFPQVGSGTAETNGPAVIYYGLTLVITLMYFIMRQGYKRYEFVVLGIMSLVYAFSLQKLTPLAERNLYQYFLPLLVFFGLMWPILKYVFLNQRVRATRMLIFSILSAIDFAIAFGLMYLFLGIQTDASFWQSRFLSGLMLFIFMSFGMSIADYILIKIELAKSKTAWFQSKPGSGDDQDDNAKID